MKDTCFYRKFKIESVSKEYSIYTMTSKFKTKYFKNKLMI